MMELFQKGRGDLAKNECPGTGLRNKHTRRFRRPKVSEIVCAGEFILRSKRVNPAYFLISVQLNTNRDSTQD